MKLQKFRIGEKVKTAKGIGFVMDVRSWRESVLTMTDQEAKLFTSEVKYKVGHKGDYRGYQRVLVGLKSRALWFDNLDAEKMP